MAKKTAMVKPPPAGARRGDPSGSPKKKKAPGPVPPPKRYIPVEPSPPFGDPDHVLRSLGNDRAYTVISTLNDVGFVGIEGWLVQFEGVNGRSMVKYEGDHWVIRPLLKSSK